MAAESAGPLVPQLDLAAVSKNPELLSTIDTVVKIKPRETPEELTARLNKETMELAAKLHKDAITTYYGVVKEGLALLVFLICVIIIGYICLSIILEKPPGANPEAQKWAQSIISGAAGGLLGFLVGKSAKDSSE
jgi:hypothetical protein